MSGFRYVGLNSSDDALHLAKMIASAAKKAAMVKMAERGHIRRQRREARRQLSKIERGG